ncbi:polysaccharide deacetylase family protein [Bradyrhizobium sp. sBnM-33]|uniref:polysaccharide deacetylase family protein n=1 Tax=Bradyrhizobium sp. sBnM-33 TaxID=2831780 RepID=UPI001BCF7E89|nr:polysaccharide deacetylase family protein [Bradyrhizobium sp. sBnM-33]WOH48817.1 polysaccharide deacetylase family protein [Bradyrhizobium sp. sBnM-33]
MTARTEPPHIVVTVDVEDFFEPRPPFDTYRAETGGEPWGAPLIMDILERHGGHGTFFVDVYNRRTVSEALVANCVQEIAARGHEVGLHTHPAFPEGRRGYGMAQTMKAHSLAEQAEFVADGVAMIERWIGKRPVSHRAGGYGANYDTLAALAAIGISVDSSVFHGYSHCGLNEPPLTVNAPVWHSGVLEVPVTVTRCELAFGPLRLFSMVKKLDPDWCSPGELRRQIDATIAADAGPVLLFLHSYSLLDIENGFRPDARSAEVLNSLLGYAISRHSARLTTLAEAARVYPADRPDALAPPPVVRSDLAWRDRELAFWLARKVRPRHVRAALGLR